MKKPILISTIALIILILDQIIKNQILNLNKEIILTNFLSLTFIQNTGAGFGILSGNNKLLLIISLLIVGVLFFFYPEIKDKKSQIAYSLILGGALGNILDRLKHGFVIDYLNFSFWPAFNLADAAITIGAIILIYQNIKKK